MSDAPTDRMHRALIELTLQQFSGVAALALSGRLVADPGLCQPNGTPGLAATDGVDIFYHPKQMNTLPIAEAMGVLAHEVGHKLLCHPARFKDVLGKPPTPPTAEWLQLWMLAQIAADHVINRWVIGELKLQLPKGVVPPWPKDASFEEVFAELKKHAQACPKHGKGKGKCSCSLPHLPEGMGDVLIPATVEQVRAGAAQAAQVEVLLKAAGQFPGSASEQARQDANARRDWREVLAAFCSGERYDEPSWERVDRRLLPTGVVWPTLFRPTLQGIGVGVDTSGSTWGEIARAFARETLALAREHDGPLTVWMFDVDVHPQEIYHEDELQIVGGGGTCYVALMRHAAESGVRALVVLTDGWCGSFGDDPGVPVLWVVTENAAFAPPFGEVVRW